MCRQYLHGRGTRFYPPTGGASRAFGLPLAAKRFLRAGAHTHFCGPRAEGQREETGRCPAMDSLRPAGFRYAVAKEAIFSLSWNPNKSAPVWPCEALCRVNGGSVAPESPVVFPSPLRAAFAETSESLSLTPSCSYECPDNSSRNPWLSEKNSGMACFPATPYQNFYVREEAETWKSEQETGSSPSG